MSDLILPQTQYFQNIPQEKREISLGRSEYSYKKQDQIERFLCRQLPVLSKKGKGLIIDTHSGDGGVTYHPQRDFISGGSIKTTPSICVYYAKKYGADVILCEKKGETRKKLISNFPDIEVLKDNSLLLQKINDIKKYAWLLVINDPNGYGDQSFNILESLSKIVMCSDFIIVFNSRSLRRASGLLKNHENSIHKEPCVRNTYKSASENQWMFVDDEWKKRLSKRMLIKSKINISNAFCAEIMLISNFIPGVRK